MTENLAQSLIYLRNGEDGVKVLPQIKTTEEEWSPVVPIIVKRAATECGPYNLTLGWPIPILRHLRRGRLGAEC